MEALKYTRQEHMLNTFLLIMQILREIKVRRLISLQGLFCFTAHVLEGLSSEVARYHSLPQISVVAQNIAYISSWGSEHCLKKIAMWELNFQDLSYWAFIHLEMCASLMSSVVLEG